MFKQRIIISLLGFCAFSYAQVNQPVQIQQLPNRTAPIIQDMPSATEVRQNTMQQGIQQQQVRGVTNKNRAPQMRDIIQQDRTQPIIHY